MAQNLDSLWTSFKQKPLAGVCGTFAFATETTTMYRGAKKLL